MLFPCTSSSLLVQPVSLCGSGCHLLLAVGSVGPSRPKPPILAPELSDIFPSSGSALLQARCHLKTESDTSGNHKPSVLVPFLCLQICLSPPLSQPGPSRGFWCPRCVLYRPRRSAVRCDGVTVSILLPGTHTILCFAVVGAGCEDITPSCSVSVLEQKVQRFLCVVLFPHLVENSPFFAVSFALLDGLSWSLKVFSFLFLGSQCPSFQDEDGERGVCLVGFAVLIFKMPITARLAGKGTGSRGLVLAHLHKKYFSRQFSSFLPLGAHFWCPWPAGSCSIPALLRPLCCWFLLSCE